MADNDVKYAYTYDSAGMFLARIEADKSHLEEDVYILPPNCTMEAPPETPEGRIPRWNGSSWETVTDRRVEDTTPIRKLEEFLSLNPDVVELLRR